ncbi:MAG TPA: cell division protein FtsZ [Solirubrobacteraceae bacterium]|jgi:cell division protein FtsZ|nr:cell division protein FtsZ [Solirubrobacteraceae bacterium]
MAQSKRASMREGPLAALFSKTEDDQKPAEAAQRALPDTEAGDQPVEPAEVAAPTATAATAAEQPAASAEEEPSVPSPRERLRNVFSAEIPASLMERPEAATAAGAAASEETAAKARRAAGEAGEKAPRAARRAKAGEPAEVAAGEIPPVDVYAREESRAAVSPPMGGSQPVIQPVIRVVGVGGAGVNAVNRMVEAEVAGVEFLAINTDLQSLQQSTADITLHIGAELTRGLGSGSDTELGKAAAMEDYDRAKALLKGSDMIFITAGAGGGTGTGAAPIVARIAREVGALAVAIVTKPFGFEGSRRAEAAEQGIEALAEEVDTLIVVPNNRLLSVLDKQTSMVDAFRVADDVLRQGVQGISDLVTLPGLINLDFADVRTIMSSAGNALLGIGMGAGGEHRAVEAAMKAVESPLLETSMEGARSILLSITGGRDLSLWEVNEAAKAVSEAAHPDANIIFGAMVDEKLEDQVWVTVVATGYDQERRTSRGSLRGRLQEPEGEPRVTRAERAGAAPRRERRSGAMAELDVPEFMPRG